MKLAIKSVLTLKSTSVFQFVFYYYFHTFRSLNKVDSLGLLTGWVLNVTAILNEAVERLTKLFDKESSCDPLLRLLFNKAINIHEFVLHRLMDGKRFFEILKLISSLRRL